MALFRSNVSGGIPAGVRTLPTVDTASGSVATFDTDMTENLVEVKCQIVAKQSGSGTPSPSNPRPISGWSTCNGALCGKNYFNTGSWYRAYDISLNYLIVGDDTVFLKAGTYKLSYEYKSIDVGSVNSFWRLYNQHVTSVVVGSQVQYGTLAGTTASDWKYTECDIVITQDGWFGIDDGQLRGGISYRNIMLNAGSTALPYVAYNGTTFTVNFGQTVYGGEIDVTTGKLRVTMSQLVDLGDYTWVNEGNGQARVGAIQPSYLFTGDVVCDSYQGINSITLTDNTIAITNSQIYPIIRVKDTVNIPDSASASDIKTFMTGKKACFELETPTEIQLSATQITALLNENNIWCDTNGDTSVKYILSVGKAIS